MKNMKHILILLVSLAAYSVAVAKPEAILYLPKERSGKIPTAVWLHGYRGYPGALKEVYFQEFADRLGIAIIGFPGTTDLGDDTQQWSEEPVADQAYIQMRLHELGEKNNLDVSRVALFGFSQGAMLAADLCTLYPQCYAGAIIMSPGGIGEPSASKIPMALHREQMFWVVCGAEEHPGNVRLTKYYAQLLKSLGATVTEIEYPGMKEHTRPPDFKEKFPEWIGQILKLNIKKK
jgi:predicted esterase